MLIRSRQLARAPLFVRLANTLIQTLLRAGLRFGPMILLTVTGRKSGEPRTTPVALFEADGRRYLFSTFGEVNWVHNLRAAGRAWLTRGRAQEPVAAVELSPEAAAPVLYEAFAPYLASVAMRPMLRAWYGLTPRSSGDDLIDVARRHPVFELH